MNDRFRKDDEPTLVGRSITPKPDESLLPRLIVISGPGVGGQFPIKDPVSIGRSVTNDVVLADGLLSRKHAAIGPGPGGGFVLEDCESRNGTFLNEEPITRAPLKFGDKIRIGDTVLLFTHQNPVEDGLMHKARLELLGRLGAGIAHDFNNLLGAALASVQCLSLFDDKTPLKDGEVVGAISDIESALTQAAELSRRLVEISRAHGHSVDRVSVSELCVDVGKLLRRTTMRNVEIKADIARNLEVMGDKGRLHQVLMNLCLNARDALPNGGTVTITAKKGVAEAGLPAHSGGMVEISVSDTGVGMNEEASARAFDPFFTTKDQGAGTGLGLATVLEIVKYHAGRISVESKLGQGTIFRVALPAAPEDAKKLTGETFTSIPVIERLGEPRKSKTRVLVIDDNDIIRRSLDRLLRQSGYAVTTVDNGADGLKEFANQKPHIILLDLDMPDMAGDEVYHALRKDDQTLPIIIMSGHGVAQMTDEALWGSNLPAFVQKPFNADIIRKKISAALAGIPSDHD